MVYGAILEEGNRCYTHLLELLRAIDPMQTDFHWLITDCECFPKSPENDERFSKEYVFLSGEALTQLVEEDDFQWVWAVFSAFKKDIALEEILKYPLPYADGNPYFWKKPLTIQHPLAQIEIVAFDSSLTLFLSREKALVECFKIAFPESEDLHQYNESIKP